MASRRARRFLPLSPSSSEASTPCPRSSRKTVMSMSSENREMSPNALDSDVPSLNNSRGPPGGRPLNRASRVQQTQSLSRHSGRPCRGAPQDPEKDPSLGIGCRDHRLEVRVQAASPIAFLARGRLGLVLALALSSRVVAAALGSHPGSSRTKLCIQVGRVLKPSSRSLRMAAP